MEYKVGYKLLIYKVITAQRKQLPTGLWYITCWKSGSNWADGVVYVQG